MRSRKHSFILLQHALLILSTVLLMPLGNDGFTLHRMHTHGIRCVADSFSGRSDWYFSQSLSERRLLLPNVRSNRPHRTTYVDVISGTTESGEVLMVNEVSYCVQYVDNIS